MRQVHVWHKLSWTAQRALQSPTHKAPKNNWYWRD